MRDQRRQRRQIRAVDDPLVKIHSRAFPGTTVSVTLKEEEVPDAAYEDTFIEEREDE